MEGLSTETLEQVRRSLVMAGTLPRDVALGLLAEIHRLRAEVAVLDAGRERSAGQPGGCNP